MISLEDDSCATCKSSKKTHDELMMRFGSIRYPVLVRPSIAQLEEYTPEIASYEIRICREFVPKMQIFDSAGNLVSSPRQ